MPFADFYSEVCCTRVQIRAVFIVTAEGLVWVIVRRSKELDISRLNQIPIITSYLLQPGLDVEGWIRDILFHCDSVLTDEVIVGSIDFR